ncbi:hypothetical protein BVI1335_1580003 [Burkholderia vietnamiensis]|nr:hypothetical protein BVI1335_1580003 [Burkholderia vietnamiensis]
MTKRVNGRLVSSSAWNVSTGTISTVERWTATTSYLRSSRLITLPSPNQPPDGTPENVQPRPEALKIASFSRPRCTPIQYSDGASRCAITSPASCRSACDCASTSAWCSGASARNHAHWPNIVARSGSGAGSAGTMGAAAATAESGASNAPGPAGVTVATVATAVTVKSADRSSGGSAWGAAVSGGATGWSCMGAGLRG